MTLRNNNGSLIPFLIPICYNPPVFGFGFVFLCYTGLILDFIFFSILLLLLAL